MKYFRIKNWDKYQHRDTLRGIGPMKWIRMEVGLLFDEKTRELDTNSRLTWMLLLLYSGQSRNKLPWSPRLLKSILGTARVPDLALFEDIGLIEVFHASNMPADCAQNASPEKSRAEQSTAAALRAADAPAESAKVDSSKILEIWNHYAKQPLNGLFPRRLESIIAAWLEKPDYGYWEDIFRAAAASEFLKNPDKRNKPWKVTLEWVMQHHIEISEGKFKDEEKKNALLHSAPLR